MKQRVLAGAAAVILICSAVLVRSLLVGDDDGGGGGGRAPSQRPVVACTPELRSVCDALVADDLIVDAGTTLDLGDLDELPDELDGWIGWDPGPRVAGFATGTEAWGVGEPLGSAPLAVLATPDALASACGETVTWSCVADGAGAGLAVGVGDPATTDGLARLAPFPGVDGAWATDDFDEVAERAERLVASPPGPQDDALTMAARLVTQPGSLDLALVPEGVARAQAATSQGTSRGLEAAVPTPSRAATVVVTRVPGGDELDLDGWCDAAADALRSVGLDACRGTTMADELAGLLFQVHERVG